jgi:hypothetical protein
MGPRGHGRGGKIPALKIKTKNKLNKPSSSKPSQHNQFMDLDSEVDLSSDEQQQQHPVREKSPPKPPPFTIQGLDYHHVMDLLKRFKNCYTLKLTSSGVQVFPINKDTFQKMKQHFDNQGTQYFTHALREEQMSKFVLHGYINVEETTLMDQLKAIKLEPARVKKMSVKQKKHFDHSVYLIYFNRSSNIKISQLREVKAIENVIVKWEYYSNRRSGPIQCSNCMSFGHGGLNCFLLPRCIRCSLVHKSIDCPKLFNERKMQTRTRIPDNELKCVNCGQNHAANYSKCEKRLEFIQRQTKHRMKTQNHPPTLQQFMPAPQLNDFQFPRLSPQAATVPPVSNNRPQVTAAQSNQSNQELFTTSECMAIFKEMMSKMQRAKSKMDQISVMTEIVLKYLAP